MADREQIWKIVADFSSLTRNAKQASKAVRDLDKARADAVRNSNKHLQTDKEASQLEKLTAALQAATEARRKDNAATNASNRVQKSSTLALTRATTARRADADALDMHSDSASANAHAVSSSNARVRDSSTALRANARAARSASHSHGTLGRAARRSGSEIRSMAQGTSTLHRLIQDTIPVSRSWGLIMKMLPLTAVTSGINGLIPTVNALGGAFVGLMATITPVFGILGALPSMLTGVAGGIGGMLAGLAGIGGAFGKWRALQEAQTKAIQKTSKASDSEARTRQRNVRNTTRSLQRAERDRLRAARDVRDAEARIAEVARDNYRRVVDGERAVANAQMDARRAQMAVNDARKQAAKSIEDYRDKLRGAALDEESATLDLQRARAELARILLDPGSTEFERKSADLAVRQAQFRLDEIRDSNRELEKEAAEAQKRGIEGSAEVVAAKEAEAEANMRVSDAQEDLKRTYEDNAKAVETANRGLEDARQAYVDSGERVQDLREDLSDLNAKIEETDDVAKASATQLAAYEAAMAKLPPAARLVVEELIALSEAWDDVAYSAQEAISPGVLSFLQDLRFTLLPFISTFLTRMARGAGDFFEELGNLLTTRRNLVNLIAIFEDGYDFMDLMGEAALNLVDLFLGLGAAARQSGLTRWLGGVIRSWTEGWANAVRTPEGITNTAEGMRDAMYYTEKWGEAISATWGFFKTFFRAFRPLGVWMLDNITNMFNRWEEWARSDSGEEKIRVWQELAKINLSGLSNFIRTLAAQGEKMFGNIDFQRIWDALNGTVEGGGLINALGDLLGIVDERMIVNLIDLGTAIFGVLQALGESGGMEAVVGFVDAIGGIVDIASDALRVIPGLSTVVMGLITLMASKKFLVAMGALTGVKPVADAIAIAGSKGYRRGDGLGKAATAEYMGYGNMVPDRNTPAGEKAYGSGVGILASPQSRAEARRAKEEARRLSRTQKTTSRVDARRAKSIRANVAPTAPQTAWLKDYDAKMAKATTSTKKMTRATGALGGMIGMVGFFAATAALGALDKALSGSVPSIQQVENALNDLKQGTGDLDILFTDGANGTKALTDTVGTLGEGLQRTAGRNGFQRFNDELSKTVGGLIGITPPIEDVEEVFRNLDSTIATMDPEQATASFKEIRDQAKELGIPVEDLIEMFPEYAAEVNRLSIENGNGTLSGNLLADAMEGVYPPLKDVQKGLKNSKDGFEDHTESMDESIKRWRDEKDAIEEWKGVIADARGNALELQEAQDQALRSRMEMTEATKELSAAERTLDPDSMVGLDNREMMRGYASDILAVAESMNEVNGNTVEGNQYIRDQRDALYNELITTWGMAPAAAQEFLDVLQLFPEEDVAVGILVETEKLSEEQIEDIYNLIAQFPPDVQREILITAQTDGYEEAREAIEFFDKYRNGIHIPVDIGGARGMATTDAKGNVTSVTFPNSGGIAMRAEGGPISGPGTSTSDSIPALLSDGEYVVRTSAVRRIGESTLDYINRKGRLPGFKTGGMVKKFARGGSVSGAGASLLVQANNITGTFSSLSKNLGDWGKALQIWWRDMWSNMSLGLSVNISKMTTALGTPWDNLWLRTRNTATNNLNQMLMDIRTFTTSFSTAWRGLMGTMETPIRNGVNFVNNSLGSLVNKVAQFYGVKKTPFPVNVPAFDTGGWTGPGSKLQPAGIVHADEYVIKKDSRKNIERQAPGALDYMNRTGRFPGYAVGGRVRPVPHAESGSYAGHSGIDYRSPIGTPVKAADSGVVTAIKRLSSSYGWSLYQSFANGIKGVYAHLSSFAASVGQRVQKGQTVAYSGNTGNSTGPHLHFEVTNAGLGRASNREFTRRWLALQSEGMAPGSAGSMDGGLLESLTNFISGSSSTLQKFTSSLSQGSPWGDIVGKSIAKIGEWTKEKFAAFGFGSSGVSGNFGSGTQRDNAFGIIDIAMRRGLGHRGALLGLMTAMQESSLINLRGGDRDSVGLFQQRPSQGWGTVAQIMNPSYSANKFFDALVRLRNWQSGPEWQDIQAVQISAFPTAYQKHKDRALQYLDEWSRSRGRGFAGGGWTGPGSRMKPAGVVHADEYVIKKSSRRKLESQSPGYLDYLNETGSLPGYATGGQVAYPGRSAFRLGKSHPAVTTLGKWLVAAGFGKHYRVGPGPVFTMADLRNVQDYQRSQGWRGSDADGYPGPTSWSRLSKLPAVQKLTAAAATQAAEKVSTPAAKPSALDVVIASLESQNKQMGEFYGYLNTLRGQGFVNLFDHLRDLGPNGIPDEFRDSENPVSGIQLAKSLANSVSNARRYEEALKQSAKYGGEVDNLTKKMEEMVTILAWGTAGPYSLQAVARELGVSLDTASMLFRKASSSGMLKSVANSRTSRIRGDIVEFDKLFKFAKGGIVPGVGNQDSVLSLLTPGELVVPKNIVNQMFSPNAPANMTANFTRAVGRTDTTTGTGAGVVYEFNTNVYNPVAEESSVSVQKRVKSVASLGLLGGRKSS